MMQVGSQVLCRPEWEFGVRHGYDKNPGVIVALLQDEIFEIYWQDGHISLASENELRPYYQS